jgi:hypothetical protein
MPRQPDFSSAASFIWMNGRLLDRLRFGWQFRDGSVANVLAALRPYQNADGGFGNGLEPDLRGPISQPQPVEFALRILDELDALADPMVERACDYLLSITTAEGGVPFVLPTAKDFPHAPWWNTGPEPPASINPTGALAGLLHKHGVAHAWLGPATDYCWRAIEQEAELGGYDFLSILTFLEFVPDRERAAAAFERTTRALLAGDTITLDPDFAEHGFMPLDFAPSPTSPARRLFDDGTIERHLDGLVARQQPDGGWPIGWQPPSPLAELEWRGHVTLRALSVLRAYGRLNST